MNKRSKTKDKGIALYTIELDGCLNGVYTSNTDEGIISNEIAKRKLNQEENSENWDLAGEYSCSYFHRNCTRHGERLIITQCGRTYSFEWVENNKVTFKGVGYKMNSRQIAVNYWQE